MAKKRTANKPPLYYLHVWWARRPLTPSRAAILALLLPADTDTDWFFRELGIAKSVAQINGRVWTLDPNDEVLGRRIEVKNGKRHLRVDRTVLSRLSKENRFRAENCKLIQEMVQKNPLLEQHPAIRRWCDESQPLREPFPAEGSRVPVILTTADPAWFKELMVIAKAVGVRVPNMYGYDRAYTHNPTRTPNPKVILDPTAGGGSIPFGGLRGRHARAAGSTAD